MFQSFVAPRKDSAMTARRARENSTNLRSPSAGRLAQESGPEFRPRQCRGIMRSSSTGAVKTTPSGIAARLVSGLGERPDRVSSHCSKRCPRPSVAPPTRRRAAQGRLLRVVMALVEADESVERRIKSVGMVQSPRKVQLVAPALKRENLIFRRTTDRLRAEVGESDGEE